MKADLMDTSNVWLGTQKELIPRMQSVQKMVVVPYGIIKEVLF